MASEGEGCAHLTKIDRCFYIREETNYHREEGLKATVDAGGEYDPLILSK